MGRSVDASVFEGPATFQDNAYSGHGHGQSHGHGHVTVMVTDKVTGRGAALWARVT